jgi:hypothetical protein
MFIIVRVVLGAIHIQELEAVHQWGLFLLGRGVLLASWDGSLKRCRTLVVVPLDLGSFVGPAES